MNRAITSQPLVTRQEIAGDMAQLKETEFDTAIRHFRPPTQSNFLRNTLFAVAGILCVIGAAIGRSLW